ncbi:MAG TPA: hypothetical protein VFZ57_10880, partial [Thermoanaerobaculia bacterium]|nr:hypothetical protein [Thermoanaerobaculia bacterium]
MPRPEPEARGKHGGGGEPERGEAPSPLGWAPGDCDEAGGHERREGKRQPLAFREDAGAEEKRRRDGLRPPRTPEKEQEPAAEERSEGQ